MNLCVLSGRIGSVKKSGEGEKTRYNFSVAHEVYDSKKNESKTEWYWMTLFQGQMKSLDKVLQVGNLVEVQGTLSIGLKNDQESIQIIARKVDVVLWKKKDSKNTEPEENNETGDEE